MKPLRSEEASPGPVEIVTRTLPVDAPPKPRAVLSTAEAPRTLWTAPTEATVVGSGAVATLTADGPDRFASVRRAAENLFSNGDVLAEVPAARPRLFGGFAFHDDHGDAPPWEGYPGAEFVLPREQITYTDEGAWLTVNAVAGGPETAERRLAEAAERLDTCAVSGPPADPPGIRRREEALSADAWRETVGSATDRIEAGELRKVVLAQALEATLADSLSLPDALSRLGETYPDCFRFLAEPPEGAAGFFGATPERLVSLRGRAVETGALAGTTGRGETEAEDEWLADELLADPKNAHEHDLVVEAIREQLEPYAASIETGDRGIRRLATVQHIETPIAATLAGDEHVLRLVEALHPTPAVGGLPPDEAFSTIRETEPFERGWYAAPIGWFDAAGDGSFAVALRSAVVRGDAATLFAGVGIVRDSDPDREWDEVQLKYRPILDELE